MVKENKKAKAEVQETEEEEMPDLTDETETIVAQEPVKEEKAVEEPEAKEEVAPAEEKEAPKKKKKEDEIVEERVYTIPLGKALVRPPKKRAPRAMQLIKTFLVRHMKLDVKVPEDEEEEMPQLFISQEVNEKVWGRGIEKPPRKIRVRAAKNKDGDVTVYLAENA